MYITRLPKGNPNGTPLEKLACFNFPTTVAIIEAINYAVQTSGSLQPFEALQADWFKEIYELDKSNTPVETKRIQLGVMRPYAYQLGCAIKAARFMTTDSEHRTGDKSSTFRVGDEVEVSDNGADWGTAYYAYTNPTGRHWVALTKDHIDRPQYLISYQHIRRVDPVTEVTLQELIDKYEHTTGTKVKVKP